MGVLQSSVNWVIQQAHDRLGDPYVYGGVYSPTDTSQGCDCSGAVGWVLEALVNTPTDMSWAHNVSTESWYYDYDNNVPAAPGSVGPYGTIAVANLSDIPADAALTIDIMHGGGGEDSHTNCVIPLPGSAPFEGVLVESNGDYGSCTNGSGAYSANASLWTDHWYLPGPWVMDVSPADGPSPSPSTQTYIVQSGDTLDSIAERFGVTVTALEAANPSITNPNVIDVGQLINIPIRPTLLLDPGLPRFHKQKRYQDDHVATAIWKRGKKELVWRVDGPNGSTRTKALAHVGHWKAKP